MSKLFGGFPQLWQQQQKKISTTEKGWRPDKLQWCQVTPASRGLLQQRLKQKNKQKKTAGGGWAVVKCTRDTYPLLHKPIKKFGAWITKISPVIHNLGTTLFSVTCCEPFPPFPSESVMGFLNLANDSKLPLRIPWGQGNRKSLRRSRLYVASEQYLSDFNVAELSCFLKQWLTQQFWHWVWCPSVALGLIFCPFRMLLPSCPGRPHLLTNQCPQNTF